MDLNFRPFGLHGEDLDFDFRRTERPRLVTNILAACLQSPDRTAVGPEQIEDWSLSDRLEKLLHIAFLSRPQPLRAAIRCHHPGCGQISEVEFSEAELSALAPAAAQDTVEISFQGQSIRLRRPSAKDQYQWLKRSYATETEAAAAILRTLSYATDNSGLPDQGVSTAVLEKISQAMEMFDPLVAFKTQVACPDCGQTQTEEVDLEGLALKRLHEIQQDLLQVIHQLAGNYHWTEREILRMPAWRRQYYIEKIQSESFL